jgi:hypothetical protein
MKKTEPTTVESKEPMSLEEARAFVRTITEADPLSVCNPKEGYDYGWFCVDGNHPQCVDWAKERGWVEVKNGDGETNPFGKVRFRELQLMRRPRAIGEAFLEARKKHYDEMVRSAEKAYFNIQEEAEKTAVDGVPERTIII